MSSMCEHDKQFQAVTDNIQHLREDMKDEFKEVKDEIKTIKDSFVRKVEFEPIRNIVYGAVTLILISVVGALLALVVRSGVMAK